MKMYFILLATLLVAANGAPSVPGNSDLKSDEHFVAYLSKVITLFKGTMKKGIKPLGIPVTEPLVVPTIKVDEHKGALDLTGSIEELTVIHLSEFQVDKLEANLAQMYADLNIIVPQFEVNGKYTIHGTIGHILPLDGSSTFHVQGKDVTVAAKIKLSKRNDTLQCTDIKLAIDVSKDGFKVVIRDLYDDPQLSKVISEVMSDAGVLLYKHFKSDVSTKLQGIVMKAINDELSKESFKAIISGKGIPLPLGSPGH